MCRLPPISQYSFCKETGFWCVWLLPKDTLCSCAPTSGPFNFPWSDACIGTKHDPQWRCNVMPFHLLLVSHISSTSVKVLNLWKSRCDANTASFFVASFTADPPSSGQNSNGSIIRQPSQPVLGILHRAVPFSLEEGAKGRPPRHSEEFLDVGLFWMHQPVGPKCGKTRGPQKDPRPQVGVFFFFSSLFVF